MGSVLAAARSGVGFCLAAVCRGVLAAAGAGGGAAAAAAAVSGGRSASPSGRPPSRRVPHCPPSRRPLVRHRARFGIKQMDLRLEEDGVLDIDSVIDTCLEAHVEVYGGVYGRYDDLLSLVERMDFRQGTLHFLRQLLVSRALKPSRLCLHTKSRP